MITTITSSCVLLFHKGVKKQRFSARNLKAKNSWLASLEEAKGQILGIASEKSDSLPAEAVFSVCTTSCSCRRGPCNTHLDFRQGGRLIIVFLFLFNGAPGLWRLRQGSVVHGVVEHKLASSSKSECSAFEYVTRVPFDTIRFYSISTMLVSMMNVYQVVDKNTELLAGGPSTEHLGGMLCNFFRSALAWSFTCLETWTFRSHKSATSLGAQKVWHQIWWTETFWRKPLLNELILNRPCWSHPRSQRG